MYTPLYVKSNYSFYESLIRIEDLINYCKDNNIKEVALTDENMIGTMYFYNVAKKNDIKPLIGLEVKLNEFKILLYAKNYKGYQNLIKIETRKTELSVELIKQYLSNLIMILPYESRVLFEEFKNVSDLYLGFSNKKEEREVSLISINVVFINKVLYFEKKDLSNYKFLDLLKNKKTINDESQFIEDNNYFLTNEELVELSSKKGIDNTNYIASSCEAVFPKKSNLIPHFKNRHNVSSDEYLTTLSMTGLSRRFNDKVSVKHKERLVYELDIIKKMGFSDYFLIVYDYVRYAKSNNILVCPRGSAGGSLVAYSLGIIDVDPLFYNLLFERFLNPGRVSMPDIDIDFPDLYREDIIKYTRDKYGEKKVAGIVTIGTLRAKSVVDEVSKVLNINLKKIELIKRFLDNNISLKEVYDANEAFKNIIDNDDELKELFRLSLLLEGFPRNISVHASGIVISEDDLDEDIPLIKQDDGYITSYEMDYLEDIGLLKMDFLGNRNLAIIMDIIKNVKEMDNVDIDFLNIPLDDKKTLDLFYRIDTNGIFHFESDAMKHLLSSLKIKEFNDIILADSLVRPGPDSKTFLERRNNNIEVEYPNDEIKEVLNETHGVLVYQEQIMRLVSVMAGFNLQTADIIRRAMTKHNTKELNRYKDQFIEGSLKNGYSKELSEEYFEDILNFAKYGFNKAHAVLYSLIAYKMGYLKANYPKAFYISLLSTIMGNDSKISEIVKDAKKVGINFYLPDINKSTNKFEKEGDGIIFPLSNIKSIGNIIANDIVKVRGKGFKDIFDVMTKLTEININKKNIESLIYASSFDSFGYNKNTLIENLDNLLNYSFIAKGLEDDLIEKPEIVVYEELSSDILMSKEKELFGFYLSYHPVTKYKEEYKVVYLDKLKDYNNREVDTVILVERVKLHEDKNKNTMAFIRGSDEETTVDFILFSKVFDTVKDVKKGDILLIRGRVEVKTRLQIVVNMAKILNR